MTSSYLQQLRKYTKALEREEKIKFIVPKPELGAERILYGSVWCPVWVLDSIIEIRSNINQFLNTFSTMPVEGSSRFAYCKVTIIRPSQVKPEYQYVFRDARCTNRIQIVEMLEEGIFGTVPPEELVAP